MSLELLRLIRKKRRQWRAYTQYNTNEKLLEYRQTNKLCKRMTRDAKRKFEIGLTKTTNMDSTKFFNYIKRKRSIKDAINPLKVDNKLITDEKGIADCLNTFFCFVFNNEADDPPELDPIDANSSYSDPQITLTKVEKKIKNLKRMGAPGPDGIFPSAIWSL